MFLSRGWGVLPSKLLRRSSGGRAPAAERLARATGLANPPRERLRDTAGTPLQITPTIQALVPALHASDLGTKKAKSKHKEGQVGAAAGGQERPKPGPAGPWALAAGPLRACQRPVWRGRLKRGGG